MLQGLRQKGDRWRQWEAMATGGVLQYIPGLNPQCCICIFVFISLLQHATSLWTARIVIQDVLTVRKSFDLKLTAVHGTALLWTVLTCLLVDCSGMGIWTHILVDKMFPFPGIQVYLHIRGRKRQKQRRRHKRQLFHNKGKKHQTTSCLYILTLPIREIQEIRFFSPSEYNSCATVKRPSCLLSSTACIQ